MLILRKIPTLLLILSMGVIFSCARQPRAYQPAGVAGGGPIYTAYNVWYQKPDCIPSINFKVGTLIPAGKKVVSVQLGWLRTSPLISFTTADGATYNIQFVRRYHPGLTVEAFCDRLFTGKNFDELTSGLSEQEIQGIKTGTLKTKMGKRAVLIAYGYPPEHVNPSLEANTWRYWEDRVHKKEVHFGEDGRTSRGPAESSDDL
jgi:hypothetical protein